MTSRNNYKAVTGTQGREALTKDQLARVAASRLAGAFQVPESQRKRSKKRHWWNKG